MEQSGVEIGQCARDPAGEKLSRGMAGPHRKTSFDMTASARHLSFAKCHGGEQVIEHGFARLVAQALLA